jgi:hypothetical protein
MASWVVVGSWQLASWHLHYVLVFYPSKHLLQPTIGFKNIYIDIYLINSWDHSIPVPVYNSRDAPDTGTGTDLAGYLVCRTSNQSEPDIRLNVRLNMQVF